jgi:hypothetical protein
MKIGILGSGPLAVEISCRILAVGGEVQLWTEKNEASMLCDPYLPWKQLTTSWGREQLNWVLPLEERPSWDQYNQHYLLPLKNLFSVDTYCDPSKVDRVQKCRTGLQERLSDNERFQDLFRVVSRSDEDFEKYQEVDVVIDAREYHSRMYFAGIGGPAIGELEPRIQDFIHYLPFTKLESDQIQKRLLMVGEGDMFLRQIYYLLKKQKELYPEDESLLYIVSNHDLSLSTLSEQTKDTDFKILFNELILELEQKQKAKEIIYHQQVDEWNELESFEKVKKKRPVSPQASFEYISLSGILSIDRFLDQEELFVTLEKKDHELNNSLRTVRVNRVVVSHSFRQDYQVFRYLWEEGKKEKGILFPLTTTLSSNSYAEWLSSNLPQIDLCMDKIFSLFTKRDSV